MSESYYYYIAGALTSILLLRLIIISFLKKIILILTPSNASGSGGKISICRGQHCLNGSSSCPSAGKIGGKYFATFPGHPLSTPFLLSLSFAFSTHGQGASLGGSGSHL